MWATLGSKSEILILEINMLSYTIVELQLGRETSMISQINSDRTLVWVSTIFPAYGIDIDVMLLSIIALDIN